MDKKLLNGTEAKEQLLEGMKILEEAVGSTLGPKGQCVVIDDYSEGKPLVTKDGVTVARSIDLKDKFKNLGVQLLREASIRTVDMVGDSTTSTVVLAYELIKRCTEMIDRYNLNPILLKHMLQEPFQRIIESVRTQAIPVTNDDLQQVATISSNNDTEIGKLIADAFKIIGRNGVITVEESPNIHTYVDTITGMQFDRGYESPEFSTDFIKQQCVLENVLIFITDQKVQLMRDIVPVLEIAVKQHKPILLIATDYDDEVIQNLRINKRQGRIQVCAVKAPSYGEYRTKILEDLAILTNAQVATYESGIELSKVTIEMLGKCEKIIVTRDSTTIIDGKGSKELIEARVAQIDAELNHLSDSLDRDFLKDFYAQRKAKLTGGISCIRVGGMTDLEMRERRDRIEDAVCATKAAIEEGVVPGGGLSFINAYLNTKFEDEIVDYICQGLYSISKKILQNCGIEGDLSLFKDRVGFDANAMKMSDLIDAGVVNPVKADRLALENAISVLNLYLSSSCLIINEEVTF